MKNARIVAVGEGMLELARGPAGWALQYGGDTLNSAVHLARAGFNVAYLTGLGPDPFSAQMRAAWEAEGLDTSLVATHPDRHPGLYAIQVDEEGERSFTYWRGDSAARQMFSLPGTDERLNRAASADLLIFSLVSLAILPPQGRERLYELAGRVRANGGRVAFDGNYRPKLWESLGTARAARDRALMLCDFGFPTLDDECALTGASTAGAVMSYWRSQGVREIIVKLGKEGCLIGDTLVPPPERLPAVDTSGAGDAFNAGYLAARLSGSNEVHSARVGHSLAAWAIGRRGAIPPQDELSPYRELRAAGSFVHETVRSHGYPGEKI